MTCEAVICQAASVRECRRKPTWKVLLTTGIWLYYCSPHKGARISSYQGYVWERVESRKARSK